MHCAMAANTRAHCSEWCSGRAKHQCTMAWALCVLWQGTVSILSTVLLVDWVLLLVGESNENRFLGAFTWRFSVDARSFFCHGIVQYCNRIIRIAGGVKRWLQLGGNPPQTWTQTQRRPQSPASHTPPCPGQTLHYKGKFQASGPYY
jgi:hypothetical protein